ncbi:DUF222 domain-containing protein [Hamadaea sp. NPDC051192]|uniref:HNH endonuclease signature motif containing protein n=1 Tax=Hamadaea sp. NPDC051192 TaxID=3154940 RepID=UPI003439ABF5
MFEGGVPADLGEPLRDASSLDLSSLDGGARVDVLCAVARSVAREQARLLEAMASVAATSTGIGFDADEVAFALCLPRVAAQSQVALAIDLIRRLPRVLDSLRAGRICFARARVFSEVLQPVADDGLARDLADRFLRPAENWTASQLRSRLRKAVLDADPDAARVRYERSIEERRVSLVANDDTTASLAGIFLPPVKAAAAFERVDAIARGLKRDGEARTLEQLRADVFCDLLAGISPASGPIVRAGAVELVVPLTTLAGLSDSPGEVAGYGPVVADIARQVAAAQAALVEPNIAAAAGDDVAPRPPVRWRYRVYDDDGTLLYHGTTRARPTEADSPDLARTQNDAPRGEGGLFGERALKNEAGLAGEGGLKTEAGHAGEGGPKSETGLGGHDGLGGGAGLGGEDGHDVQPKAHTGARTRDRPANQRPRPPMQDDETTRFPNAALRKWVNARDVTCRAPGCTAPARSCDTDHTVDHAAGGRTRHDNLGLLCRHHHRLKHEGGFRVDQPEPGRFRWTSPNGRSYEVLPEPP